MSKPRAAADVSMGWLTRRQVTALLHVTDARVAAMDGRRLFPRSVADRRRRYAPPRHGAGEKKVGDA
jgi:hypothetical protein